MVYTHDQGNNYYGCTLPALDKLIEKSSKLGSLPAIVHRVFEVMDEPHSTATQIGRVINEDPALTARLLKLVNSPFYGFTAKVDTVYRAVALIGHKELRSVVVAASAIKVFDGIPSELVSMPVFWKRSLLTAVVARVLAAFRREREIERYFISGLLHDIGSLLLYLQLPEEMREVLMQAKEGEPLHEVEKDMLGFNHAEVGGALLKKWNLPPTIGQSVTYQLYPARAPEAHQAAAWLLKLAKSVVECHFSSEGVELMLEQPGEVEDELWQMNDLDPSLLPKILEKTEQQYEGSKDILLS